MASAPSAWAQDRSPFDDPAYSVLWLTPEAGPVFWLPADVRLQTVQVEVNDRIAPPESYTVDADLVAVRIERAVLDTTRSLRIAYRRVPIELGRSISLTDTSLIRGDTAAVRSVDRLTPMRPSASSIQSRGSVSRGVTAGSNRDVGLESGLRVELSGEVSPGVTLRALLNDENTPILPDGTTRRLEDFDRVFIELTAPFGEAQLGDIAFRMDRSEFGRITRSLQGAAVRSDTRAFAGDGINASVVAAGAVSRGQFRSLSLAIIDGVQGPYRLTGSAGERLILVVPGSERVYWDGVLLERGDDRDYIIDYATGEIRFTSRRIVTDERRVLVEFEYSTNQFTRTLLATQTEVAFFDGGRGPRARIGGGLIREADGNQFLEEFGLSRADSLALAAAGRGEAVRPGAEPVAFDPEAPFVQYVLRPTPEGTDSVFVALTFRPEPEETVYRVRFSHVGEGLGAYQRGGEGVNGIAYRHVGAGMGAYDPVRVLPRPMAQQLFDLFGSVSILPNLEVFGEWARSDFDQNRLSALEDARDAGDAMLAGVRLVPISLTDGVRVGGEVRRRRVGATFAAFDRIRPVEFERHWNLGTGATPAGRDARFEREETIDEGRVEIHALGVGDMRLEAGRLTLGDAFDGRRFAAQLTRQPDRWPGVEYRMEQLLSEDRIARRDGDWFRQRGLLQQQIGGIGVNPFVEFEHEHRRMEVMGSDSLGLDSFRFLRLMPGVRWARDDFGTGDFSVSFRRDAEWLDGVLHPASQSMTTAFTHALVPSPRLSADVRLGYRHRTYEDVFRGAGRSDQASMLVQWQARWRPDPRALEFTTSYDVTGDRTPILQEVFVRVGPEFGQYVWEDLNSDGVIQPDELIPERTPNEGTYARTFIPTDSLVATTSVSARVTARIDPSEAWRGAEGVRGVLSQMSLRSSFEVFETTRDPDLRRIYMLYLTRFRQPGLTVTGRMRTAHEVTIFPRSRTGRIELGFNQMESLNSRTGGDDERLIRMWRGSAWVRLSELATVRNDVSLERNRHRSQAFATRRFDINAVRVEPEASLRPHRDVRITLRLPMAWKDDVVGGRSAVLLRTPVEARLQRAGRFSLAARTEVSRVSVSGDVLGLAEFELTDGRGPGTSYLWGATGQYQVSEYLRASVQYDGRLPEGRTAVHTMRMQLSAVF